MLVKINNGGYQTNETDDILTSALKSNIFLEHSCKTGRCGVCKVKLLEGSVEPIKEQIAISELDQKENFILTCCCVAKGNISIDAENIPQLQDIKTVISPVKIQKLDFHNLEIAEIELRLPPSKKIRFLEGQYIDIILNDTLRRSYSIASTNDNSNIKLYVKRVANGAMSNYFFEKAKKDDLLRIEGPKGTFFLRDKNKPLIFIATGTGIAPIQSVLEKLDSEYIVRDNPIYLFWGNRFEQDFFWEPNFKKIKILYRKCISSQKKHGLNYVQNFVLDEIPDLTHFDVYACGSIKMIEDAKAVFSKHGLSKNNFFSDAFVQSF